jgi:PAS domain S-box-containing protein
MSQQGSPDSSARLAAIVSSSDDAIISKDLNGYITSWNAGAERMFGYSAAEAIGQPVSMLVPPERANEEQHVLSQIKAGAAIDHYETVRRRKDGTLMDVSLAVSPIRNSSGAVIGASKIIRDITANKHLEREVVRLAAIVTSSDDAIVSKDLNGIIQTWNGGAERIFGWKADEIIGKSITVIIPEERLSEETEVLSRIRRGLSVEHFETVRKRKDGSLVDISLTVSPVRTSDGRVIGASKIARDNTEQKRLQAAAEEASRLKDEFLAVLSHELRTPLNTVVGYSRMLRRDDEKMSEEMRERALDALERNADSLTRLVNDVLDTSRIVTGKLRLAFENCAIDRLIEEAIDTVRPTADAKGVILEGHSEPNLTALGDKDRLLQVVWNLLSNAVKFTPRGGRVVVEGVKRHGTVDIVVRDSGVGIRSEHLSLVFQRFGQAPTGVSREFGGLGIGLALARHLVEMHGGTISASSEGPGKGATFTVSLPSAGAVFARERNLRSVRK